MDFYPNKKRFICAFIFLMIYIFLELIFFSFNDLVGHYCITDNGIPSGFSKDTIVRNRLFIEHYGNSTNITAYRPHYLSPLLLSQNDYACSDKDYYYKSLKAVLFKLMLPMVVLYLISCLIFSKK